VISMAIEGIPLELGLAISLRKPMLSNS